MVKDSWPKQDLSNQYILLVFQWRLDWHMGGGGGGGGARAKGLRERKMRMKKKARAKAKAIGKSKA